MLEDYFFTKNTRWVLWGLFALVLAFLIFHAGVVVGEHQPMRGHFGPDGRAPGPLGGFMPQEAFIDGHGAVGTVATVTLPMFTMTTRGGGAQTVETGSSTTVTGGQTGTTADLAHGETVVIIGDPKEADNDATGDLDARIIHILPAPPAHQ
jgi:hypothetical protein